MIARLAQPLRDALRRTLLRQWAALGAGSPGAAVATAIVDPEALVLSSLMLRNYEPRLREPVGRFATTASGLLSVQRMKNLAAHYPASARSALSHFARLALEEGRDFRWRSLLNGSNGGVRPERPADPGDEGVDVLHPTALVLRLRLGIGVGIKADVVARLLGGEGAWCDVRDLATATTYSERAVRRASEDLAAAGLVRVRWGIPAGYRVESESWRALLELPSPLPPWRHWASAYAFIADVLDWASEHGADVASPYRVSERADGLLREHREALEVNRVAAARPRNAGRWPAVDAFAGTLEVLSSWLRDSA